MSTDQPPHDRAREDELAGRLARLSPAKRVLLEREIRKRNANFGREPVIRRRPGRNPGPLSFAQQRLWFLSQLEPHSVAYNEPKTFRIEGPLDLKALQRALDEIVARHEVLRTTFAPGNGEPVQCVHPGGTVDLSLVDLRARGSARDREAQQILREAIRRPFDLSADLMLRAFLLRLADDEHILMLATHHVASDGWSMGILTRELGTLYESFATGRTTTLPELPIQYADYAWWQRQPAQAEIVDAQLEYWRRQLTGAPVLELPSDRPRTGPRTYESATQAIELPEDLCRQLKQLSRRGQATLYMTLLAALQLLLHRYSGQEDIAIGSPIAGRTEAEVDGLIGFFVNTLVLRTDLSGNPSFRELLGRVRKVALGAFEHQAAPFERLVAELHPERNPGRHPFFDVMFAFQNMPADEGLRLPGHRVSSIELDSGISKFDLVFTLMEDGDVVRGSLDYCVDLFDALTIRRLVGHFETLLRSAVATPDAAISDLRMLTDAESRQLVVDWNRTATDYPRDASIHTLFETQARQSPDAVAVAFGDEQLTYQELNWRANQVAHYLSGLNLQSAPLIAISMDRSLDLVVGLLGILKTGRAYLPLDPEHPAERLDYMLRDTQVAVVLTSERITARFMAHGVHAIALDAEREQIAAQSRENPASTTTADDLAYVMYTSGSTGRPKGVEIPHRGVVRLVCASNYVRLDAGETLLHLAPISFDASTFEIWGALLHGATCAVFAGPVPRSTELGGVLKRYRVSTLWLTASLFNLIIDEDPGALASVRQLLIGGEALSVRHVERALSSLPNTSIINGYGPTESTTFACTYPIRSLPPYAASIPIGKPIANTEVYVLDSRLALAPVGVPGELYIGGDGLARGYLNAPDLTAEKFKEVAFDDGSRRRLYRTGDRVRYLADGNIEFLGRFDDQVKIRGFRIEPGEIEVALAQHPGVRENAVLAREKPGEDKRLIAYLLASTPAPTAADLKTFLKAKLPDYMVPSGFVFVDAWPLTPNGKVDRRALSTIDWKPAAGGEGFIACRTPLEQQLADIWMRALGVERLGATDNFFDLGGHSLLAVRVCSQIEKSSGKRLPLTAFFEAPTVEGLARLLSDETPAPHWQSLLRIQTMGSRPPFFWVHGQASDPLLPRYLHPEQPLYGLMHQAHDGRPAKYTSVEEIAAHYLSEVRAVRPNGPYLLGGYCFGGVVAFEMAQQLRKLGEPVDLLVLLGPSPVSLPRGVRRLAPSTATPAVKEGPRLRERLSHHRQTVARLDSRQRIAYALGLVNSRTAHVRARAGRHWHRALLRVYLTLGWELPVRLRSPYVLDLYRRALDRYAPSVYQGRTAVFVEVDEEAVEYLTVEGSGRRRSLLPSARRAHGDPGGAEHPDVG